MPFRECSELILDMREYDVPYYVRASIDKSKHCSEYRLCSATLDIRVGLWYEIDISGGEVSFKSRTDLIGRAEPRVQNYLASRLLT